MAAKTSAEMKEALQLVKSGMTARDAAKQAGVREESLYRHPDYKQLRIEAGAPVREKKMPRALTRKIYPMTQTQLLDAERLKKIFKRRQAEDPSLTQTKLALKCGWSGQSAAQQYLSGAIPLNLDALIKFALVLNVPITDISPTLSQKIIDAVALLKATHPA